MKSHLMIALGLLMVAVFIARTLEALQAEAFGWNFLYIAGGFVFGIALIVIGLRERRKQK